MSILETREKFFFPAFTITICNDLKTVYSIVKQFVELHFFENSVSRKNNVQFFMVNNKSSISTNAMKKQYFNNKDKNFKNQEYKLNNNNLGRRALEKYCTFENFIQKKRNSEWSNEACILIERVLGECWTGNVVLIDTTSETI